MKIAEKAIENKTTTLVLTAVMLIGGAWAFNGMGRLEDPEFTIKDALITTPYPGATAAEVGEEVSDEIEIAIQRLKQLDQVESLSMRGLSIVTATMKDQYDKNSLPQVWDELRRKVTDMQSRLPPGAGPSIVNDDYGDVFGVFVALYGDEYSYAELNDVAEFLQKELLLMQDVARIDLYGIQPEVVYVELDRDRMSQLGIPISVVVNELRQKNAVSDAGKVQVGPDFIAIDPTGVVNSVEDFEGILISGQGSPQQIYLRDIADVRRGYGEPSTTRLRFDGHRAIGIGISALPDGNVVTMGQAIGRRTQELLGQIPLGMQFGLIAVESTAVTESINGFVMSLAQAVAIVIVVLLLFMGLRSGLLIGFILLVTISGSFVFMQAWGVTLERISLGALIIALGMLVDNAIVVVDGMLVKLQQGRDPKSAATETVETTAMPLLGATLVAVLAFAAIGTSQDATGEYTRSLFQVILISLMLSWVTAVTTTPLLGMMFLKAPKVKDQGKDPFDTGFYRRYRALLRGCIRFRWISVTVVLGIFGASLYGFGYVKQSFFPNSTRPQFMIDYWLPQGTHIDRTTADVVEIEDYLLQQEGVTHVASVIGQGAPRFVLTYAPEKQNSAYAQFLVEVDDSRKIDGMMLEMQAYLEENYVDAVPQTRKFILGPAEPGKIQARFFGSDPDVLRRLASQTEEIFHGQPNAFGIRSDWRQRVLVVRPVIAEEQANLNGITRRAVSLTLLEGFEGATAGVYREGDDLLPIILRAPDLLRTDISSMQNLQIWSPAAGRMIPLRQVVAGFESVFEDEIIYRVDRKRAIKVLADPRVGEGPTLLNAVRPQVEAIQLPPDYELEWWGEYKDSAAAQAALMGSLPVFFLAMVLIVIVLFNAIRQPLIIWLVVPLALIGVTFGLLITGFPFGFMAVLGFMSLSGMLIKNAIVLIDQIDIELREGKDAFNAILDSGVSRLRPVSMAAATTVLGMAPLMPDAFFQSMAVTIAAGLTFATLLTMIVVPVLYAIFFRVPSPAKPESPA